MNLQKKTAISTSAEVSSQGSQLARLQQFVVCWTCSLAVLTVAWWWDRSTPVAMLAGVLVVMGFSLVLGLEFWLAVREHRDDTTPRASGYQVLKAWWSETQVAAAVFSWRQPFRWRHLPDTLTDDQETLAGSQLKPGRPVVLVHGFVCNRGFWHPWMRELRANGISYLSMNLEPVMGGIDGFVDQLENAVQTVEACGNKPVLICHSMGGLVTRAWMVAKPGNGQRIDRLITIGSPHQGTWLARWSRTFSGKQMRINSRWLKELRERELSLATTGPATKTTCWYSNIDNIVFPPSMATLPGADNRLIEGVGHVSLAFHQTVMQESLAMLASGGSSPITRTAS